MSVLFLAIGNSASGKDAVIGYAIKKIPNLKKAKRCITRPSSITEDFESIEKKDFKKEDYCLWWESYDKLYGIKAEDLMLDLINGTSVILNISRDAIDNAKKLWKNCYIIEFNAPLELIEKRLNERKREKPEEIEKRIKRAKTQFNIIPDIIIDSSNSDVSIAGEKLKEFILEVLKNIKS